MTDFIGPGNCGAVFSDCRAYRYTLWRRWEPECDPSRMVAFIGLNPSTADETVNDPTVRRCIGFAKDWGYGGMVMLNLFAYRATDPKVMKRIADPVGDQNDAAIASVAKVTAEVIAAWGTHGCHMGRDRSVIATLRHLSNAALVYHLGRTRGGFPKHPLYLKADSVRTLLLIGL